MKKVSLLAASVALALTGCGGSDGGSDSNNTGVVITGFDGYFKNAVVFEDTDNDGVWDTDETVLGLTDEKGQVTLTAKPASTLALQTITPNGVKQQQLIAVDSAYAGTYTVDMDHPGQAMAHEVVFRAPNSSDVISPITDLVAIEMANDSELTEEDAIAKISLALGGTEEAPIDLYSDFVSGSAKNVALHKAAQILTESKAQNPASYVNKATGFAEVAIDIVNSMTEEEVADVNNKPVIEDSSPESDELSSVTVINNTKLTINESVKTAVEETLNNLEIVQGTVFDGATIDVEGLFQDKDQSLVTPELTESLSDTGIEVSLTGDQLVLSSAEASKAGDFQITLTAQDLNASGKVLSEVSVVFTIKAESENQAPAVAEAEQTRLQSIIDGWQLQQGELFEQTLDISGLFTDADGDMLTYSADYVDVEGLELSIDGNSVITIKGTPVNAYDAGRAVSVSASDGEIAVQIPLLLPEVTEGTPVEPEQPATPTGFTLDHFDGRIWKMGSFAQEDGEIGYAMLMQGTAGLEFCWGTGDEMNQEYKANISDWNDAYTILETLDAATGYASAENKDCWGVTLQQDGTLLSSEGSKYQVLYQNVTADNHYQILMAVGSQELFWLDSADIPFAQTMPISEKVSDGVVEYDMTVEASEQFYEELDGPELGYSAGKLTYATGTYVFDSILPTGFTTPGNYSIEKDSLTGMDQLILEETGEMSDYKTRYRYVNRDFGDFYIGIKWNEEEGFESQEEYGLYTQNEQLMRNLLANLPILQD